MVGVVSEERFDTFDLSPDGRRAVAIKQGDISIEPGTEFPSTSPLEVEAGAVDELELVQIPATREKRVSQIERSATTASVLKLLQPQVRRVLRERLERSRGRSGPGRGGPDRGWSRQWRMRWDRVKAAEAKYAAMGETAEKLESTLKGFQGHRHARGAQGNQKGPEGPALGFLVVCVDGRDRGRGRGFPWEFSTGGGCARS